MNAALNVISRACAAILGGYLIASAFAILLAEVLPMPRAEATLTGLLFSFAFYTTVVIWAYAQRNLRRVWAGVLGTSALLGIAIWIVSG